MTLTFPSRLTFPQVQQEKEQVYRTVKNIEFKREEKEYVISLHSTTSLRTLNGAQRTSALVTVSNCTE